MKCKVAIFDLDGTLIREESWRPYSRYLVRHGFALPAAVFYAIHLPLYCLMRLGFFHRDELYYRWIENLGKILRGLPTERVRRILREVASAGPLLDIRPELIRRMKVLRSRGYTIVIASGAYHDFLEIMNESIGADVLIGTHIIERGGRLTGEIAGRTCAGVEKRRRILAYFRSRGMEVDFASSTAFGNDGMDRPMLELVGHPVAVNPARGLRAIAREKGWPVLELP
jgi:HAD superfamily hydrolase (TIGR01490 family)